MKTALMVVDFYFPSLFTERETSKKLFSKVAILTQTPTINLKPCPLNLQFHKLTEKNYIKCLFFFAYVHVLHDVETCGLTSFSSCHKLFVFIGGFFCLQKSLLFFTKQMCSFFKHLNDAYPAFFKRSYLNFKSSL